MFKLVSAGLFRLRKSLCFKIYLEFGFLYSLSNAILHHFDVVKMEIGISEYGSNDMLELYSYNADSALFDAAMTMLLAAAVFTALFIGREYGDGTMRNKLIVGYGRSDVYLSNLIVCITANAAGLLLALGTAVTLGVMMDGTEFTFGEIVLRIAFIIAANIAVTALMVFGTMLISSKAGGCAALLISVFVLLLVSIAIEGSLNTPEYYTDYKMTINENGESSIDAGGEVRNPYYISGMQRRIYEFIDKASPVSQLYHMAAAAEIPDHAAALAADGAILVIISGAGILIFGKKNIK